MAAANEAIVVKPGEGTNLWSMGALMQIALGASQTDGAATVMDVQFPGGAATPVHIHHREAEINYVLDGEMLFQCGTERFVCPRGSVLYLPKGVQHAFKAGPDGGRLLFVTLPGGIEELYAKVGRPAEALRVPSEPPNVAGWFQHSGEFGIEILGPPIG